VIIKVLYKEITCCPECPYYQYHYYSNLCMNKDKGDSKVLETSIPKDCPLPNFRLDTEDDGIE
jgi:hypothetical protein